MGCVAYVLVELNTDGLRIICSMLSRSTGRNHRMGKVVHGDFVSFHGEGDVAVVTSGEQGGIVRHGEDGRLPFTYDGIETRDPR